ncbi:hypothetical protein [Clostridium cellulovorans]|uniref:MotA/TolQ/ExbB proton channel domain-containing protein n=1 Tax=Clostridium cellulovorans (strain ATCC 35296 / DSM 3052 / OCM 3 / 743B) TaxID=573061 RepID=D9SRE2_CLOC7|nr:hypothetical protein [Clostridium cellulovorans]ADL52371.1 hypothetical protein Clocel_2671 [Clostridium cellulovorans 743B]
MFFSQGLSGIFICSVIVILMVLNIMYALKIKEFYKELITDLKNKRENSANKFSSKLLESTYNSFKGAVSKGVTNVNTQVIIQENIPRQYITVERLLEYVQSLVIILGLFGTFIGLALAIGSIKDVLLQLQGVDASIGEFLSKLSTPLSSMATAFYTSIFGIASSIVIKIVGIYTYKEVKEQYLDEMESYLDNVVMAEHSIDYVRVLVSLVKNLERNSKNLCDGIKNAFEKSFEGFAEKAIPLAVELTKSAQAIEKTSKVQEGVITNFNNAINSLNRPILSFKNSVDKFEGYYEGVSTEIAALDKVVNNLALQFKVNSDALKDNKDAIVEVNKELSQMFRSNIEAIEEQKLFIEKMAKNMDKSYKQFELTIGSTRAESEFATTKDKINGFFNKKR